MLDNLMTGLALMASLESFIAIFIGLACIAAAHTAAPLLQF